MIAIVGCSKLIIKLCKDLKGVMIIPSILYGNMKDGPARPPTEFMTAYQLAKLDYKTLVCDLDPQANAT